MYILYTNIWRPLKGTECPPFPNEFAGTLSTNQIWYIDLQTDQSSDDKQEKIKGMSFKLYHISVLKDAILYFRPKHWLT